MNDNFRFVLKFIGGTIVVIVLLVFGLKYIFLDRAPALPETSTYAFDLDAIRDLAIAPDSTLPLRLNRLVVGDASFPRTLVVAGDGWDALNMTFASFQLVYSNTTLIIDPVHSARIHGQVYANGTYRPAAWDTQQEAMRRASMIVATHEHFDHVGGIGEADDLRAIHDRVVLTDAQLSSMGTDEDLRPIFPQDTLALFTPLDYDTYHALAPGVVLIEAAGHTPGSQMIFIRLQNGEELLLVGDVVWNEANITTGRGRPLLIAQMGGEDRAATAHKLRTLMDLHATGSPTLIISHDGAQHEALIARGLLGEGFE